MYLSIALLQQAVSTSVTRWAVAAEITPQSVLDGQRGHIFRNRRLFADDQIEELKRFTILKRRVYASASPRSDPLSFDLNVPCPTLTLICPARGSDDNRYAVHL